MPRIAAATPEQRVDSAERLAKSTSAYVSLASALCRYDDVVDVPAESALRPSFMPG